MLKINSQHTKKYKPKNKFFEEDRKDGINSNKIDEVDITTNKLINKRMSVLDNILAEFIKFWKTLFLDALLQFEHKF